MVLGLPVLLKLRLLVTRLTRPMRLLAAARAPEKQVTKGTHMYMRHRHHECRGLVLTSNMPLPVLACALRLRHW
jgi:hypothetical protein